MANMEKEATKPYRLTLTDSAGSVLDFYDVTTWTDPEAYNLAQRFAAMEIIHEIRAEIARDLVRKGENP